MSTTSKKPSIKKLNQNLVTHLITGGGKESPTAFKDKALKVSQVTKRKGAVIEHYFSESYNAHISLTRFYVHVSQAVDGAPVLWLSRRQYKTCRACHKYFQLLPLESRDGSLVTVWRNMTFRLPASRSHIQIEAVNDADDFDLWSGVDAKSKKTTKLPLVAATRS